MHTHTHTHASSFSLLCPAPLHPLTDFLLNSSRLQQTCDLYPMLLLVCYCCTTGCYFILVVLLDYCEHATSAPGELGGEIRHVSRNRARTQVLSAGAEVARLRKWRVWCLLALVDCTLIGSHAIDINQSQSPTQTHASCANLRVHAHTTCMHTTKQRHGSVYDAIVV